MHYELCIKKSNPERAANKVSASQTAQRKTKKMHELTPDIKQWLDTPPESRSLEAGATILLRVTRNRILYDNIIRKSNLKALEYHLNKIYTRRQISETREQVREMIGQVEQIAGARSLSASGRTEMQRGRRADHDSLPEEIRKLYDENTEIMRRMRECHTHLRLINESNSSCPDNDRYPWAKQIIAYDRQYRDNWNRYDNYVPGTPPAAAQLAVDPRTASANAAKTCNMLLGKYMKLDTPDPRLADRIREAYARVASPTIALSQKMAAAGLIQDK